MMRTPSARIRDGGSIAGLESAASTVHRLAVLLSAGVAPHSAWGYLAQGSAVAREVVRLVEGGAGVADAVIAVAGSRAQDATAWRAVAVAWLVASSAGAPLAPALRSFAGSLRELAQSQRDVRVALAGPAATTRVVLSLPVVGILFGAALGFDTLGVLVGTPPGQLCLALGAVLLLLARRWNGRLLRAATPTGQAPGLRLDLVAIAVSGGFAVGTALTSVESALARCGVSLGDADAVDDVLELSRRAGVPAAELLRAEAEETRRRERGIAQRAAARLGVTLMIPLGVCVLPAFMLVGVVPLVLAVLSSTVAGV